MLLLALATMRSAVRPMAPLSMGGAVGSGLLAARHFCIRGGAISASLDNDENKALYALGFNVGRQLGDLNCLSAAEVDSVLMGMRASVLGEESEVSLPDYVPMAQDLLQQKKEALAAKSAELGKMFLEKVKTTPVHTESHTLHPFPRSPPPSSPVTTPTPYPRPYPYPSSPPALPPFPTLTPPRPFRIRPQRRRAQSRQTQGSSFSSYRLGVAMRLLRRTASRFPHPRTKPNP